MIELSIPFETNIADTHQRKLNRYASLVNDLSDKGYKADLLAFEVGSRGFLSADNIYDLKPIIHLSGTSIPFKTVRNNLIKIIISTSSSIYCSKSEPTWLDPLICQL